MLGLSTETSERTCSSDSLQIIYGDRDPFERQSFWAHNVSVTLINIQEFGAGHVQDMRCGMLHDMPSPDSGLRN